MLTAWVGIAHAALVTVSYFLLRLAPGPRASDDEFIAFFGSGDRWIVILVGLYLMPFAGIAFLWFAVALRMWISRSTSKVDALFSNLQLTSGIVFLAMFFSAAAASSVLAASIQFSDVPVDPQTARQFTQLASTLWLVFAMRMAAVFVFTTSSIGWRHRILPRWFVAGGVVMGVFLLLSASLTPVLALVFPLWVLGLSVLLLDRARRT